MKKLIIISLTSLFFNFILINTSHSKTTITTTGIIPEDSEAYTSILHDFDKVAATNGPYLTDAFAMANILGYPIGKAYLGSLPHFEFGIAGGAGCTDMKYFDESDTAKKNGSWPMIVPNAVVHFGIGIGGGFDILGKIMYDDPTVYKPPHLSYKDTSLNDFKIYSTGGKIRYNLVENIPLLPVLLEFDGITVSLGADMMYGRFDIGGKYNQDLSDTDILGYNVDDLKFSGKQSSIIEYSVFSVTSQIVGYLDLFYFVSLYTGFGLTGNFGFFKVEFDGTGELSSKTYATLTGGSPQIGTVTFISKNKFHPSYFTPTYIIGLEINILVVKLNIESMVNLRNGSDVNIQFGTRIGI